MQARWYDPTSGQFLSVDPVVAETGATYNYAGDNPVDLTDPTGWFKICGPLGIGCINVDPVGGLKGAVNFFAGFANAGLRTITFGKLGVGQPFCGPGLNASYEIGEFDFGAEATIATGSGWASFFTKGADTGEGLLDVIAGEDAADMPNETFGDILNQLERATFGRELGVAAAVVLPLVAEVIYIYEVTKR